MAVWISSKKNLRKGNWYTSNTDQVFLANEH